MNAHVLLNSLNEMRKRDKMRGLQSILSLSRNKLHSLNDTEAGVLDSIFHMTLQILKNCVFGVNKLRFSPLLRNV